MEYRPLDITLISAQDLKDVNHLFRMNVYAVVNINGDARTEQKTLPHRHCGPNPKWDCTMKFAVGEAAANQDGLNLVIRLVSDRHNHGLVPGLVHDKDIGEVVVSINELLASEERVFDRNVTLQPQGTLNLRFEIGETLEHPADQQPPRQPAGESFRRELFGAAVSAAVSTAVEAAVNAMLDGCSF
ncbi:hypothetical protein SLA2020_213090 [Shorea laevis]